MMKWPMPLCARLCLLKLERTPLLPKPTLPAGELQLQLAPTRVAAAPIQALPACHPRWFVQEEARKAADKKRRRKGSASAAAGAATASNASPAGGTALDRPASTASSTPSAEASWAGLFGAWGVSRAVEGAVAVSSGTCPERLLHVSAPLRLSVPTLG